MYGTVFVDYTEWVLVGQIYCLLYISPVSFIECLACWRQIVHSGVRQRAEPKTRTSYFTHVGVRVCDVMNCVYVM